MDKFFFAVGSILAFLAVILGAFGAHAFKSRLTADMLEVFDVGVRYHMFHSLGLLAVAWASAHWPQSSANMAGWFFLFGILIFSGSLYLLSVTGLRWLGAITPLGGIAFLIGWLLLAWAAWRY
jgi:uncharacterized membrane protein YgdD (TMEM256/DUF423 family)